MERYSPQGVKSWASERQPEVADRKTPVIRVDQDPLGPPVTSLFAV